MDASETSRPIRNSSGHGTGEDDEAQSGASSPSFSEKSLEFDFHGFASSEDPTTSTLEEKNTDAKISATSEPRNYIKDSVGAVNRNQDSCIFIERPGTASCSDASDGNETQSHIGKRIFSSQRTLLIVGNKAPQPLMLQNIHRRNTLATTATNKSPHSQAVRVKHNVPTSSLQSEAQNVGPLMAVSSQDKPSSMTRSKPSITVSKWLQYLDNQSEAVKSCITSPDTPFMKTDSFEKSRADTGTSHEPRNIVPDENCKQDRSLAMKRKQEKDETVTAHTYRTYAGPIQRRVVRTKEGATRTIVIVKKSSLKNLQAKGLIQPLGKYVAGHRYAVQSLRKTNFSQGGSDSTKNPSEHTYDNLFSRKGNDLCKDSSVQQSIICEGQEPRTESGGGQYARSSVSTQTPNYHSSNKNVQASVKAAYVDDRRPDEMFHVHSAQLHKTNTSSMTNHLPQQQTASSTIGAHCTVSQPRIQIRSLVDSNQPPSRPLSSNSVISSDLGEDNEEPASTHISMQDFSQSNTSTSSSQHAVQPSAANSKFPSSGHGISSGHMDITSNEDISGGDCSLFSPLSPAGYMSDEPETSAVKPPNLLPSRVMDPGLPSENKTGVKKSDSNMVVIEVEGKMGDRPIQRKPPNRDNVRWTALPSSLFHAPQPSSSGTADQERQVADVLKQSKMATLSLTSADRPGVVYKAIPLTSLLQNGQKLHLTPPSKSPNKEFKLKYSQLLKKQRTKYYNLLRKHKALEQKYAAVSDAGTPQQVIRDAHKFLSEESVLFLESQMFLRNRPGTGNRFSRKFMQLMIEYYKRSIAGYKYLKTIFTLPSVHTVQHWMNKPLESGHSLGLVSKGNDCEETSQSPMLRITSTYQDSNSDTKPSKRTSGKKSDYEEKSSDSDNSEDSN